jgi:hypothetical protein
VENQYDTLRVPKKIEGLTVLRFMEGLMALREPERLTAEHWRDTP